MAKLSCQCHYRVSQNQPDSTLILTNTDPPVLARSDRSGHDRARVTPRRADGREFGCEFVKFVDSYNLKRAHEVKNIKNRSPVKGTNPP